MSELSIAICDDDEAALVAIRGALASILEKLNVPCQIDTYTSPVQLEKVFPQSNYSILLLDIEMPDIDGISIGKNLKLIRPTLEIIYVSNREDLVFSTFAVRPFGFVRKSRFLQDITEVIKLYLNLYEESKDPNVVCFKQNMSEVTLQTKEIMYIESAREYQYFYLKSNDDPLKLRISMDQLESQLEGAGFLRVHKGYLVNFLYIKRVDSSDLMLNTGKLIPVSRRKVDQTKTDYMRLCRQKGYVRLS